MINIDFDACVQQVEGEKEKKEKIDKLCEKLPVVDGNYELPCDPKTLGSPLIDPVPASYYEIPTDAVRSPIINESVPAVEDNYELPCHSDSLGSPLQIVSPYEMPSDSTFTPAVGGSCEVPKNPDSLGSPLTVTISPYEVPVDSCQSRFPFDRGVQTLPSSKQPYGKGTFLKPFASNTLAVISSTDHNYEEPDFPASYNYELPTDGIGSNYEAPEELPKQNDNYDTVGESSPMTLL